MQKEDSDDTDELVRACAHNQIHMHRQMERQMHIAPTHCHMHFNIGNVCAQNISQCRTMCAFYACSLLQLITT